MKSLLFFFCLLFVSVPLLADKGEDIYRTTCTACHKIGGGKLVGPDLKDITQRREQDWLVKWIKSSQTLVKEGDETALAIFEENNKVIMPDQALSDEEVLSVLEYINKQSALEPVQDQNPSAASSVSADANMSRAIQWVLILAIVLFFAVILVQSQVIRTLIKELRALQHQAD